MSAAGDTATIMLLCFDHAILIFISLLVEMATQSTFCSSSAALLFAVKNLQNTSAYQDQWIADIDLAAAIRHEYGLWDPQFDAIVSCVGI